MKSHRFIAALSLLAVAVIATGAGSQEAPSVAPLPHKLADTGLYVAGSTKEVRADVLPYTPQYALWSDGATKRRWLHVPAGAAIDATQPNAWEFPPGTKLWKEFSHGRPIETRFIERLPDGSWRFAAYVWNEHGTEATLAPATGIAALPASGAPNGRYRIPSEADCRACHEGAAVPVLGVGALQLSPERDPNAVHLERRKANDAGLRELVARGWLRNLPDAMLRNPPRIAASSPLERAALGYLHANCGHCHNDSGAQPPVDLQLAQQALPGASRADQVLASIVGAPSRYRARGLPAAAPLVDPGRPASSVLAARMRTRDPHVQMPPLGTELIDAEGLALIERWIAHQPRKEPQ
jgi:hypothetical protein